MKRNFPLFLIDRSKAEAYPFDYISCFDSAVGFVARVVFFRDDAPLNEFISQSANIEGSEYSSLAYRFSRGGVILVVEEFLFDFDLTTETKTRIRTLLKKALKKYLHAEADRTPHKDLDIDSQIQQQQLTIERAKSNYAQLVARSSKEEADYNISLAEATLETLKRFRDNQPYFNLNLN